MISIGEKIKTIRSEMQLTQKQLSRILYISRGYVSDLELNKKQPSLKVMKKINKLYREIPQVQILTPKPVESKTTWFDSFFDWLVSWRK